MLFDTSREISRGAALESSHGRKAVGNHGGFGDLMGAKLQHLGILLFVGVVVFMPGFEFFDEGQDLKEGTDTVQTVLSALTFGALAVLWTKVIALLRCWLRSSKLVTDLTPEIREISREVELAPPRLFIKFCAVLI